MNLLKNISLKPYNTFRIDVKAKLFIDIHTQQELIELLSSSLLKEERFLIIGGGSNFVFVNDFDGIIVRMSNKGIQVVKETNDTIWLKVQAGEKWEDFVQYCVDKNWAGMENMAMIPGCIGAAPVQNVGAYGAEAKDVIEQVETFEIATAKQHTFTNSACEFAYRDSIFKNKLKDQYIVSSVIFQLNKQVVVNTEYGSIQQELQKKGISKPTIKQVSEAVCHIREDKLPSPDKIGSAGSFFKNPIISEEQFKEVQKQFPDIVNYPDKKGIKVAAGWMIEQCGWKGKNIGQAGVHAKQALVLINLGNATGQEVYELSKAIQLSVKNKFGIHLEPEANIVI